MSTHALFSSQFNVQILVVGGVALDITATAVKSATLPSVLHTSTPGGLRHTLGGVGRNVCETAMRTGATAHLVSITGDDMQGKIVRQSLKDIGMVMNTRLVVGFLHCSFMQFLVRETHPSAAWS